MPPKLIEIKNLSKSFGHGKTFAIKEINLTINKGEVYGIIGMSGAGKSTLLRCLTGLERPSSGSILIENVDLSKAKGKELSNLRKEIGMVFQHFYLFSSRTVAENIAYPMEIYGVSEAEQKERIVELLDLVGLSGKRDAYPSQLSGGEKQRVGIARALANKPNLLLCDEPTSALDPKTTRSILKLLEELNQSLGLTIVIITHQIEVVKQICTRLAVLSEGKLVEEGEMTDLFVRPAHAVTAHLLHGEIEQIPPEILAMRDSAKTLVRLCYEGESAQEPLMTQIAKNFNVDANILVGHLDSIRGKIIGNLVVELSGKTEDKENALQYLRMNHVVYEEIHDA